MTRDRRALGPDTRPSPMRYELHGVVSGPEVAEFLTERSSHVRPVLLDGAELVLVPMCPELAADIDLDGPPLDPADDFELLSRWMTAVLTAASRHGPVVYLETEYTGGVGWQSAVVWLDCHVVLGPDVLESGDPFPAVTEPGRGGSPIVRALRYLGVEAVGRHDEFVALGLGRFRSTEQWCAAWSAR
ncbi:hypothetical protein GCM10023200_47470 [Actinomycetospora chlora]|uniref:Uncharacterized protein n=1 Tax=Actinomycetospora chlora TaxID=663608 RepID=A0ABP9C8X0_9PSEU